MPADFASNSYGDQAPGPPYESRRTRRGGHLHRLWYGLLLVQFVAVLVPGFYTRKTPEAWGIPFFYWYQFLWIILAAILTAIVYLFTTASDTAADPYEEG